MNNKSQLNSFNNISKTTYPGYIGPGSPDAVDGQPDAPGTFRDECTLLKGFVDSNNTVLFHRQQEATGSESCNENSVPF